MSRSAPREQDLERLAEDFDPFCNEFWDLRQRFYGYLHANRKTLLHSSRHGGFWYAFSYGTVLDIQRRPEVFSNHRFTIPDRPVPPLIPATLDPPVHMGFKRLLSTYFTPKQAQGLRARIVQIVEPRFELARQRGNIDMVVEVMIPLMAELTMVDILGLAVSKAIPYATPVHHMTRRDFPRETAEQEIKWLTTQLRDDLESGHVDTESILGRLACAELDGRRLSQDELLNIALNLLIGGMGTTAFFTGSAVVFLGRHMAHRKLLLEQPALLAGAVEELLRAFTPTQTFGRSIKSDVVVQGAQLRQGEKVLLGYGAANFDPQVFQRPDVMDFRRQLVSHLAFGNGPHRCLGSHLAKLVAATVIDLLLRNAPEYVLDESGVKRNDAAASMFGYYSVPIHLHG